MAIAIDRTEPAGTAADEGRVPLLMLIVLMSGGVLATITFTTVTPSLPAMAEHFGAQGYGILGTQQILTMAPAGMAIGGPLAGWIGYRLGLRRQLIAGLLLYGLAGLGTLVLDQLAAFLVVRFVLGFASVNIDTAMTSILGARFSGARRARLVGIRSGISSTGTMASVLLAGRISQDYGWRAPFWLYLLAFVVAGLTILAFREPLARPARQTGGWLSTILSLWPIYVLAMLLSVAHAMPSFQMGFLLKEDGLVSPFNLSLVLALSSIVGIIGSFSFGWFYNRLKRSTIVMTMALMAAGYIVIGLFHLIPTEIAGIVIAGFGAGFTIPYLVARVLDEASAESRTRAVGFVLSFMFAGHVLNPFFSRAVRTNLGNHAIFMTTGLLLGVAALAIGLWYGAAQWRGARALAVEEAE